MKHLSQTSRFLIIILSLATLISCGASGSSSSETTTAETSAEASSAESYDYPELDLAGREFTILNTAQTYNFYTSLDFESQTGDPVDDAVYERNRDLEERFNFELVVNEEHQLDAAVKALQTAVLAGEDIYDVAFLRDMYLSAAMSEGYFADLSSAEGFAFDEPWWDGEAIEAIRMGKERAIPYAYTDVSLADFEGTVAVFFNDKLVDEYGAEVPFELAREGKWTLDRLSEFMKLGANLNGADSFELKADSETVYGLASWEQGELALVIAAGSDMITLDRGGIPRVTAAEERFINAAQRVTDMLGVEGEYVFGEGSIIGAEELFEADRALTFIGQIKATNNLRDMSSSYSILPLPKLDEAQESYRNLRTYSYVMCVPTVSQSLDETAVIMDAMSYLTYTRVMDKFYSGRVSQKGLRNDDSIEMLALIRESRCIDIGLPYGWTTNLRNLIHSAVVKGNDTLVSSIAAETPRIEASIEAMFE